MNDLAWHQPSWPAPQLFGCIHSLPPAQPSQLPSLPPGDIDETVARGLDFIIAEAAKYGIRLTLVLLNLWKVHNWCTLHCKSG